MNIQDLFLFYHRNEKKYRKELFTGRKLDTEKSHFKMEESEREFSEKALSMVLDLL